MLTHLHLKNFAIVSSLAIDFHQGLNVLTGETGAGKSIWVDAVGLALGNRADANLIRQGEARCDITLCFDLSSIPSAQHWLQQQQLDSDNECIIRRIIQRDGPSRSTINGHPCPLNLVRELGDLVLSIHSQHQHQTLLKRDTQQQALDHYAQHHTWLKDTKALHQRWHSNQQQLEQLRAQASTRDAELELLRYQAKELSDLSLKEDEWQSLSQTHQRLHNAQAMTAQLNRAIELTVGDENVTALQLLQQAIDQLNSIKAADDGLTNIKELLSTAAIHLNEAGDELQSYHQQCDLSPEKLQQIETRLSTLHDLARKHHCEPEQLFEVEKSLQQRIQTLDDIDGHIAQLSSDQKEILITYQKIAKKLTASRKKTAKVFNADISQHMQALDIKGGRFEVSLEAIDAEISPLGNERIQFLVSTNPGQDCQPMHKIVSGGELSRISLALQMLTAQKDHTPTLIFDEVDVGIGGKTADTVGQLLRQLGEKTQVLCITHLAQVASKGHHHYKVSKLSTDNSTNTQMALLDIEERTQEIARMLGGANISKEILTHARELINA